MGTSSSIPHSTGKNYNITVEFDATVVVDEVLKIAVKAGAAILQIYTGETCNWAVETKADDSPLTQADKASNELICRELAKLCPHIPIISEENTETAWEIRQNYQYCWSVDPLDGTKEFLKRNDQFTVNIALLHNQEPVFGVVHIPCTGKTYWGLKGKGSFLDELGSRKQIFCKEFTAQDAGLVIVASASHMSPETKAFVDLWQDPTFKQMGSSLKLVMVAEGTAHIYPRMAPTMEWDTAAADIIVREAGGVVLQAGRLNSKGEMLEDWKDVLLKETPMVYNKENLLNPAFVVFGKRKDVVTDASASS